MAEWPGRLLVGFEQLPFVMKDESTNQFTTQAFIMKVTKRWNVFFTRLGINGPSPSHLTTKQEIRILQLLGKLDALAAGHPAHNREA